MATHINFSSKAGLALALQQLGVDVVADDYKATQLSQMLTETLHGAHMLQVRARGAENQLAQFRNRSLLALAVTAIPLAGIAARALYVSGIEGIKSFFGYGSVDSSAALVEAKTKCDTQLAKKTEKFNKLVNVSTDLEGQRDVCMKNWGACIDKLENCTKQP